MSNEMCSIVLNFVLMVLLVLVGAKNIYYRRKEEVDKEIAESMLDGALEHQINEFLKFLKKHPAITKSSEIEEIKEIYNPLRNLLNEVVSYLAHGGTFAKLNTKVENQRLLLSTVTNTYEGFKFWGLENTYVNWSTEKPDNQPSGYIHVGKHGLVFTFNQRKMNSWDLKSKPGQ